MNDGRGRVADLQEVRSPHAYPDDATQSSAPSYHNGTHLNAEVQEPRKHGSGDAFFAHLPDAGPIAATCLLNTHPDKVLRRLGIIEGHAISKFGHDELVFSAVQQKWLSCATHKAAKPWGFKRRWDKTPKGVIHVVGQALWIPAISDGKKTVDAVIKERVEREILRREDKERCKVPEVLSPYEEARLIEQYIVYSLPQAAKRTETCIVCNGSGRLADHIGLGVHSLQDEGVSGGVPVTEIRQGHILALGISNTFENLSPSLTHHLVVENDTTCTAEQEAPIGKREWIKVRTRQLGVGKVLKLKRGEENVDEPAGRRQSDIFEDGFNRDHFVLIEPDEEALGFFKWRRKRPECKGFVCQYAHDGDTHNTHPTFEVFQQDGMNATDLTLLSTPPPSLAALLRRVCQCGKDMAPLEVSRCVCGKMDYEHVSWHEKRRQLLALRKNGLLKSAEVIDHLAFYCCKVSSAVSRRDAEDFKHRLLVILSKGYSESFVSKNIRREDAKMRAPPRSHVPVVTVLVGGDLYEKFNIAKHIHRRWALIVVEGSGGFADLLCGIIDKVQHIVLKNMAKEIAKEKQEAGLTQEETAQEAQPSGASNSGNRKVTCAAGLDDFRVFLSGIDALTAEIIINGQVDIVRKGVSPQEVVRKVENALMGNEVLTKAWYLYALWLKNSERQERSYFFFEFLIITLSTALTALVVLGTFMELYWNRHDIEPPQMLPDEANLLLYLWMFLKWSVIILPIFLTGILAVSRIAQPGPKWVSLKSCAEKLLSEIYMYRTRTKQYSRRAVSKHIRSNIPPVYTTPEELLQQRAVEHIDSLSQCEVANVTLKPYKGPLPPPWIRSAGDSGYGLLAPDLYREIRLDHTIKSVDRRASITNIKFQTASNFVLVLNALGTLLAATAPYGFGEIAVWTILTVCLATNISKYIDDHRMSLVLKRLSTASYNLSNVSMWWTGLGASADKQVHRDSLVEDTENCILDLELLWGSIISQGDEKKREGKKDVRDLEKHKRIAHMNAMKVGTKHGVDLDSLTPEALLEVFDNPTHVSKDTGVSSAVTSLLAALSKDKDKDKNDPAPPPHEEECPEEDDDDADVTPKITEALAFQKKAAEAVDRKEDPLTGLLLRKGDVLARELQEALVPDTRDAFVLQMRWLLKNKRTCAKWAFFAALETFPDVRRCLLQYNTRQLLEVFKHICAWHLFESLPNFRKILPKDIREKPTEAVAGLGAPTESTRQTMSALSNLLDPPEQSSASFWREAVTSDLYLTVTCESFAKLFPGKPLMIVKLIRNPYLRAYLRGLNEVQMLRFFEVASEWVRPGEKYFRCASMFNNCNLRIAEIDCESFLESKQLRVSLWKNIEDLLELVATKKWKKLGRESILQYLPHTIVARIKFQTPLQIGRYLEKIASGTPASRGFVASHAQYDKLLGISRKTSTQIPLIFHPTLGDREMRERVVLVSLELTQVDVNKCHKGQLKRKISLSGVGSEELLELLFEHMSDASMRFFLSVLQSKLNNTFSLKVLDKLGDDSAFDLRAAKLDTHASILVGGVSEFKGGDPVTSLPKKEIISRYGKRSLNHVLENFSEGQLRALVGDILSVSCKIYPVFVFTKLVHMVPSLLNGPMREVVWAWDPGFISLFVESLSSVDATKLDEEGSDSDDSTPRQPAIVLSSTRSGAQSSLRTSLASSARPKRPSQYASNLMESIDYDEVRLEVTQMVTALRKEVSVQETEFLRNIVGTVQRCAGDVMLADIFESAGVSLLTNPAFAVILADADEAQPKSTKRRRKKKGMSSNPSVHSQASSGSLSSRQSSPLQAPPDGGGVLSFETPDHSNVTVSVSKNIVIDLLMSSAAERDGLLLLLTRLSCETDLYASPGALNNDLLVKDSDTLLKAMSPPNVSIPEDPILGSVGSSVVPPLPPLSGSGGISGLPRIKDEGDKVLTKLKQIAKWGPDALHHVVVTCLNAITFAAPVKLFHEVAKALPTFDLRDVVSGLADRRLFTFFFADVLLRGIVTTADEIYPSQSYRLACQWLHRTPHPPGRLAEGVWKATFLREALLLSNGIYRRLVDSLRGLSEGQLFLCLTQAERVFKECSVGVYFHSYIVRVRMLITKGDDVLGDIGEAWGKWLVWYEMVCDLRARVAAVQNQERFCQLFCNFDTSLLLAKSPQILENHLNELHMAPHQQEQFLRSTADEVQAHIFAYVNPKSFGPPVSRVTNINALQHIRSAFWNSFRDTQKMVAPNTARTTASQ